MREGKYHKTFSGWEHTPKMCQIILFLLPPHPPQKRSSSRIDLEGHYDEGNELMRAEEWRQPRPGWKQVLVFHIRAAVCLARISYGQNKPHRSRDMSEREKAWDGPWRQAWEECRKQLEGVHYRAEIPGQVRDVTMFGFWGFKPAQLIRSHRELL